MRQLRLSYGIDKEILREYLEREVKKRISLTITDNSTSMISYRYEGETVLLRLHRMFLSAGRDVCDEIALFIKKKSKKTPLITKFINENGDQVTKRPSGKGIATKGRHYDLSPVFDHINEGYFNGGISCGITWGANRSRKYARTRTLGSYVEDDNMIRINPILDNRRVPKYFIEYIVYHEMLHAAIGIEKKGKRRSVHSREFRRREKLFEHYEKAMKWEKKGG